MNQAENPHKPPKITSPPTPPKGKKTLFGRAVDARAAELGISLARLAEVAGVREDTLTDIRYGRRKPQRRTLRKICQALGWHSDSYQRLMDGSDPLPLPGQPAQEQPAPAERVVLVPMVPEGTGYRTVVGPDGVEHHWLTETVAGEQVSVHVARRGGDPAQLVRDLRTVMRHLRAQLEPGEE